MCNRYRPARVTYIRDVFGFTLIEEPEPYADSIGPLQQGPFVHAGGLQVGQWGLIPWFSQTRRPTGKSGQPISTNNCRVETMASAPAFKTPWARRQRCLIPALDYDEPNWSSGKNVWWRLARRDGEPWALAGLWSQWTDPANGAAVHSYTMLTQNCDGHPLLGLMHKPDPALPPERQDKRAVVPIEPADWDCWLNGSKDDALALVKLPPAELFRHGAAEPDKQIDLLRR